MKLELKNVTKKYDLDTLGVEDVSFTVEDGVFCLCGDAGSGMGTVLGLIGGWLDADSGDILADGVRLNETEPKERCCLLIDGRGMPLRGSVMHNLTYGLRLRGVRGKEAVRRAEEAAELLGVGDMLGRRAAALPPFARLKADLARLAARRAGIALLRDPFRFLTDGEKEEAAKLLFFVRDAIGSCAVVLTTTDGGDMSLMPGGAVIRYGRLIRSGSAADILRDPRTAYTAKFVSRGHVNIIRDGGRTYAVWADGARLTDGNLPVVFSGGGYTALGAVGAPPFIVKGETRSAAAGYEVLSRVELTDEKQPETPSDAFETRKN